VTVMRSKGAGECFHETAKTRGISFAKYNEQNILQLPADWVRESMPSFHLFLSAWCTRPKLVL